MIYLKPKKKVIYILANEYIMKIKEILIILYLIDQRLKHNE